VIEEFSRHFNSKFDFRLKENQFCFIDNGVNEIPSASELQKEEFRKSL